MKNIHVGFLLVGSLTLAGCSGIIQKAADNTPVNVLPLGGKKLTGSMSALSATPLSLKAQSTYVVPFTTPPIAFGDFDSSTLPSALQNPSAVDIHLVLDKVTLACTPTASPLTMTINSVKLTVSDDSHGSQSVSSSPNAMLTLTKNATGYTVASTDILLKVPWNTFKAIVVKSGTDTPNKATLEMTATFNDGVLGCAATLDLATTIKQNVRY